MINSTKNILMAIFIPIIFVFSFGIFEIILIFVLDKTFGTVHKHGESILEFLILLLTILFPVFFYFALGFYKKFNKKEFFTAFGYFSFLCLVYFLNDISPFRYFIFNYNNFVGFVVGNLSLISLFFGSFYLLRLLEMARYFEITSILLYYAVYFYFISFLIFSLILGYCNFSQSCF